MEFYGWRQETQRKTPVQTHKIKLHFHMTIPQSCREKERYITETHMQTLHKTVACFEK